MTIDTLVAPIFVPGNRPDRYGKAARSTADAIILDLEDAVADCDKAAARQALRVDFTEKPVIVRINGCDSPHHPDDVDAVCQHPFAAIMLPKAEVGLGFEEFLAGPCGRFPIVGLIETAKGHAGARSIAATNPVRRLCFGSVDYSVDLNCAERSDVLLPARSELVLASRLAGLPAPIDGVTARLDDPDLLERDARHARDIGMGGKLCIHPIQVDTILAAFLPTEAEIDWARRVLETKQGVQAIEGQMVDAPVRARAKAILDRSV